MRIYRIAYTTKSYIVSTVSDEDFIIVPNYTSLEEARHTLRSYEEYYKKEMMLVELEITLFDAEIPCTTDFFDNTHFRVHHPRLPSVVWCGVYHDENNQLCFGHKGASTFSFHNSGNAYRRCTRLIGKEKPVQCLVRVVNRVDKIKGLLE